MTLLSHNTMSNQFAQTWLTLQCRMIAGVQRAMLMLGPMTEGALTPAASWPETNQDNELLAESGMLALKKRGPVVRSDSPHGDDHGEAPVIVACPLFRGDELFGIVALQVETLDEQQQQTLLQLLKWGATWLELFPQENDAPQITARLATVIDVTARALEQSSLQAAATAVIAQLARALSCDRVGFGLVKKQQVQVRAISNSAQIDRRSELVRRIEAAMEEALDEGATLNHSSSATAELRGQAAHEALCGGHEDAAACTVLLVNNGQSLGALTFERRHGPPFDQASVEVCEAVAALLGPIVHMKRLHDRTLLRKAGDALGDALGNLVGRKRLRTKLVTLCLIGVTAWLSLATAEYRISATAVIEGTEQRALVAAIDGYVDEAHVRAGESVSEGDLIAKLDDTDLTLDRQRLASELDDLSKRHGRAIGSMDRAEAAIIQAQLGKARAQLALLDEQLARTRIVAPFDGVIVSGDLSRSLGGPVERGQVLFELAPLGEYRMALQVPENEIGDVRSGQRGYLALSAMPGEHLPFVVDDIIGIAQTDEGENGFRVEAHLEDTTHLLRPGMRGVGKIAVGERRLLWVWGHSLYERIALWLWSHLP